MGRQAPPGGRKRGESCTPSMSPTTPAFSTLAFYRHWDIAVTIAPVVGILFNSVALLVSFPNS